MSQKYKNNDWIPEINFLIGIRQKWHRALESKNFLQECQKFKIHPKFTNLSPKTIKRFKFSPSQISAHKSKQIEDQIEIHIERINYNSAKYSRALKKLGKSLSNREHTKLENRIKNIVLKTENNRDTRRKNILKKLKKPQNNESVITIFNDTDIIIPDKIQKLLKFGIQRPVGGNPNKIALLTACENIFKSWTDFCEDRIDRLTIMEVRANLFVNFCNLGKCYSENSDLKEIKIFLLEHPNIIIVPVDKSKNINILYIDEYHKKMLETFSDQSKFEKLESDPITSDLTNFRALIKTLKPYVSKKSFHKITPNDQIKNAYGIIKRHKKGNPYRPIVASYNSVTSGSEDFLLSIIRPIRDNCKFAAKSTGDFKAALLNHRYKFNHLEHEICSYDAQSLYTNINVNRVISYILDIIYKNPTEFFNETDIDEEGNIIDLDYPPREIFQRFFHDTLLKFSSFSTVSGYYKQIQGLSMGSRLSPILADLFVNLMEESIITKHINNGNLVFYSRYVDDILVIYKKGMENTVLSDMNRFDHFLNFTIEKMTNNSLPFLDTEVYVDSENIVQLRFYKKPSASDVKLNFRHSTTPMKYKISTLVGEIYRVTRCTTTESEREIALNSLIETFTKNGYPTKLINTKIREIREKNFQSSKKPEDNNENTKTFNLSIPYTSSRCHKIAIKTIKMIKKLTPNFRINLTWKTVKLSRVITPKLKRILPNLEKSGIVYKFDCDCSESYVGETKRSLKTRISEHSWKSKNTAVHQHTTTCPHFNNALSQKTFGELPISKRQIQKIKLDNLTEKFSIISANLSNYYKRTEFEGMYISIYKPKLNEQVFHRSVTII